MRFSLHLAAAALATVAFSASAQQAAPQTLDQLLQQTRSARAEEAREHEARVQRFQSDLARQQQLLGEARADRDAQVRRADQLSAQFDANERKLGELQSQLEAKAGNLGEMFGVVRQVAGDVASVAMNSLVTVQFPERREPLNALAGSKALPSIGELETLWFEMLREINESGKVARFTAGVVSPDGVETPKEVVRIGSFVTVSGDHFLTQVTGDTRLTDLAAQPERRYRSLAGGTYKARDGYTRAAIDPTRGSLLTVLVQKPSLLEYIEAGGIVGYAIMALGLLGALIAAERFTVLNLLGGAIKSQRKQLESPRDDNPLGRVLNVYHKDPGVDHETLELRLDEAVIRELPQLEDRLPWMKIIAALAPLLGLLGTVTGMIITFQQITLFGTGDPKLMAGGISQALVTTVQGLCVAIPMVILHGWLSSKSRSLVQVLEEESAGLIAESAEKTRA